MKVIQDNKGHDHCKEPRQPPAADDGPALDIKDEEVAENGEEDDGGDESRCCRRTISRCYLHECKRQEEEQRDKVEEMKQGAYVQEGHQLSFGNILSQVGLGRQHGQFL